MPDLRLPKIGIGNVLIEHTLGIKEGCVKGNGDLKGSIMTPG